MAKAKDAAAKPAKKARKILVETNRKNLTEQQELFIKEYLIDLNATRAAKAAGYSDKTAYSIGSENLRKPDIAAKIRATLDKRFKKLDITGEKILQAVAEIAFLDPADLVDEQGVLKPIHALPPHVRRAISTVQTDVKEFKKAGKIETFSKFKIWNKENALELLGKNQKLWFELVEHSGTVGLADRLAAARKRKEDKK